MPAENLEDILCYPNHVDENNPRIVVVKTYPPKEEIEKDPKLKALYFNDLMKAKQQKMKLEIKTEEQKKKEEEQKKKDDIGQGRRILNLTQRIRGAPSSDKGPSPLLVVILIGLIAIIALYMTNALQDDSKWFILAFIFGMGFLYFLFSFSSRLSLKMGMIGGGFGSEDPKLIVDNSGKRTAPFEDATGAKAGALLGDCRHDPLQSGGLGTPAHLRIEAGAIHRSNKGVLFMDEVTSLTKHFQQELLTAMQEKKYPITGQSEMSSGAIVKTEPVPCDFVLVAAGNVPDIQTMHPALRSRIRGAGYEIYVEDHMDDTPENEEKLVKFVAQEVKKDKKIPHFTKEAVNEVINEARRKSTKKHSFTLNLRELGGIVRAAGDMAREENAQYVSAEHVKKAKKISGTLEQQIAEQYIELKKSYRVFQTKGYEIGRVNGLAVLGDPSSGLVLPIVAEVTPSFSKGSGRFIATGKLGTIAKEAVDNVSAIIKKHVKKDMSKNDVHIQFLQTYEGVEGDSASIAVAVSVISAMESLPIDQTIGMTGSLSVRGEVLPVGGVTGKVQACIEAGLKKVILPKSNLEDVYISKEDKNKIEIIPVETISDVLKHVLQKSAKTNSFIKGIKNHKK
ncbi:MAG: ATP-dependent protease LonB [Candidatus Micrarchaeia archaeon]